MAQFRLSDLFLGINDGKKEALYRKDFEKFFVDYDNNYKEILKPEKFILLGRKGSGKTILAQYLKKQTAQNPLWFCEIKSYKDFRFHELVNLKTTDISPNEYASIWRWIILIDFAKLIIEDNGIQDIENKNKLEKFFKDNYYSLNIDVKKIVEITKGGKISGSILKDILQVGAELDRQTKYSESTYLTYLEDLENVVIKLLQGSESQYTLIYDELDDRFQNDEFYKNSMISLIKAADSINYTLLENEINAKAVLLIRSDIFSLLNDTDLNKIKQINTIIINWGDQVGFDSPLIQLIVQKAKRSSPHLANKLDYEVFKILFPQEISGISPEKYILQRTLFRPRDIITLLNFVIEKYPYSNYFIWKGFFDTKDKYSDYFCNELKNEMLGHLSQAQIDQGFKLLRNFNRCTFEYSEIKEYLSNNVKLYPDIDIENLLIAFFQFNIVGNKGYNNFKNRTYFIWSHRDLNVDFDFEKQIVVHLGLQAHLSL